METTIPKGARVQLASVEGDLLVEQGATVEAKDDNIAVTGRVVCEGDASFKGNLTAERLEARQGRIVIEGSLEAGDVLSQGDATLELSQDGIVRAVNVDRDFHVGRDFRAETVEVGGLFVVGGQTLAKSINVGGAFECGSRVEVGRVVVAGSVSIVKEARIQDIDVGGSVSFGGGELSGVVKVGEKLESKGPLRFSVLEVGWYLLLAGDSKGGDLSVGGRVRVDGDLEFGTLESGGRTQVTGFCKGFSATVGGLLEVGRDLVLSNGLKVGARVKVEGELRARSLELSGPLDANFALLEQTARVGGAIDTSEGMKASRIETASNWEVSGPLIGDLVRIARNAEVQDVYAQEVHVEEKATARNIYAARVHIGNNCKVTGVIEYTESLEVGTGMISGGVRPRKVTKLPVFPSGVKLP